MGEWFYQSQAERLAAPTTAQRNIRAIIGIFRLASITAEKTARTAASGRNTIPPQSSNPHTLNEQNFHKATHISATDTGLSSIRNHPAIRLPRKRPIPASTAESMK